MAILFQLKYFNEKYIIYNLILLFNHPEFDADLYEGPNKLIFWVSSS